MEPLFNSDRDVSVGNGLCLYHGWVHSHLADSSSHSCGDTADQWTSSPLKNRQPSRRAVGFSRRSADELN